MLDIKNRAISTKYLANKLDNLSVCITFDDAFANLILNVVPIITEYQVPITIFIPAGNLGSPPEWLKNTDHTDRGEMVMTTIQLANLTDNPLVEFGSHTMNHRRLPELSEEEIRKELCLSRKIIGKITSRHIDAIALPHGAYNENIIQIALEEGYRQIFTLDPDVYIFQNRANIHRIGRYSISPDDWSIEFYLTINGAYSWLSKWRSLIRRANK